MTRHPPSISHVLVSERYAHVPVLANTRADLLEPAGRRERVSANGQQRCHSRAHTHTQRAVHSIADTGKLRRAADEKDVRAQHGPDLRVCGLDRLEDRIDDTALAHDTWECTATSFDEAAAPTAHAHTHLLRAG